MPSVQNKPNKNTKPRHSEHISLINSSRKSVLYLGGYREWPWIITPENGLQHMEAAFGRLKREGKKLHRVLEQKTQALALALPLTQWPQASPFSSLDFNLPIYPKKGWPSSDIWGFWGVLKNQQLLYWPLCDTHTAGNEWSALTSAEL